MFIIRNKRLKSSLAITTSVGCRNLCSYCPQQVFINSYRRESDIFKMSIDTFNKCIESVPINICLSFSGFSEPWLNPDCTAMILSAHQKGFKIRVNTTLIGMNITDIEKLKNIPFVKFVVHLPDNKQLTKIKTDESYLLVMDSLLKSKIQNLNWKFHQSGSDIKISPVVFEVLKKHKVKIHYTGVNNRAGNVRTNLPYFTKNKESILQECQDFHHNILLPNGDVVLCHMDWSLKHKLGNLLTENYSSLFSGDSFQRIIKGLNNIDLDILCRNCEKDLKKRNIYEKLIHHINRKFKGEQNLY
jgi:hypothetical protein